jgi:hypothetical protein
MCLRPVEISVVGSFVYMLHNIPGLFTLICKKQQLSTKKRLHVLEALGGHLIKRNGHCNYNKNFLHSGDVRLAFVLNHNVPEKD